MSPLHHSVVTARWHCNVWYFWKRAYVTYLAVSKVGHDRLHWTFYGDVMVIFVFLAFFFAVSRFFSTPGHPLLEKCWGKWFINRYKKVGIKFSRYKEKSAKMLVSKKKVGSKKVGKKWLKSENKIVTFFDLNLYRLFLCRLFLYQTKPYSLAMI